MNLLGKLFGTSYIQVLTKRNFRQLWLAALISKAGDILYDIAILWLVSEETGSALAVGAVVVSTSLPVLLLGLVGGAIADRFDRRKIMIVADLLRSVLVLALPLLYYFQILNLPAILVITFSRAVLGQFFYPAQQAVIPSTVPKASLPVANSVNQTSYLAIATSVPTLAGILIATVGPVTAFYIDAITFILSAILLFGLRLPTLTLANSKDNLTPKTLVTDIRSGIAYIFRTSILRIIAIVSLVNIFGFGPYRPVALIYFQNDIGMNAAQYGLNLSIAFAGLAIGSFIAGNWIKSFGPGRIYIVGLVVMGIMTIAVGIAPWIIVIYGLSAVRAFGNSLILVSYTTLLQSQAKEERLGRVFSTMSVISEGIRPLSVMAGTALAEVTGSQLTIIVSGLFFLVAALISNSNAHLRSKNDLTVLETA